MWSIARVAKYWQLWEVFRLESSSQYYNDYDKKITLNFNHVNTLILNKIFTKWPCKAILDHEPFTVQ